MSKELDELMLQTLAKLALEGTKTQYIVLESENNNIFYNASATRFMEIHKKR
ncbi:hypothetical protein [Psittacicella hinzii]|uniref:hypothetical protein n=1 Tax=Psittacicella hinzii TaxID=2028575 RepID=UPI001CA72218|nr:hypothetical protein [Psittacicella hinzii]